jgi:hypothetical protein
MIDTEVTLRPMILEEFTPLIGRVFTADCEPNSAELTLVEAYPLRVNLSNMRPPFMLIFHTPPEIFLVDGMYVLRCGDWGPDRISISPTIAAPDSEPGQYYQAVFN